MLTATVVDCVGVGDSESSDCTIQDDGVGWDGEIARGTGNDVQDVEGQEEGGIVSRSVGLFQAVTNQSADPGNLVHCKCTLIHMSWD